MGTFLPFRAYNTDNQLIIHSGYWTFQFHKGTIKTVKLKSTLKEADQFQFHKGTIKTLKK